MKKKFLVVRDQQEKANYWDFQESDSCAGTVVRHLKTGDYTIEGMEDKIVIERKANVDEFATNLTQSRFERELGRMSLYPQPSLLVVLLAFEFSDLVDWPGSSDAPPKVKAAIKTTGRFLIMKLCELMVKYPRVNFIFGGADSKYLASSLLKRVWEKHG